MPNTKPRTVYDTNVFLQATISPHGPAKSALDILEDGRITHYVSDAILAEVRDVLNRPAVRKKSSPHYSDADIANFIDHIEEMSVRIATPQDHFTYGRDPDDEHVINLALEVDAHYIVSRDNDLLDLMNEITDVGREFRSKFPDLKIVDPLVFIRLFSTDEETE